MGVFNICTKIAIGEGSNYLQFNIYNFFMVAEEISFPVSQTTHLLVQPDEQCTVSDV